MAHTHSFSLSDLEQLAAAALELWGITDNPPQFLKHRENTVYRVKDPEGNPAVLRIHRLGYHDEVAIRSELQWMAMLSAGGMELPCPIPTADGRLLVAAGKMYRTGQRHIDMLSWVPGDPLGVSGQPLTLTPNQIGPIFFSLGCAAAQLHNLSDHWTLPVQFRRHAWDREGLVGDSPIWGKFWELPELNSADQHLLAEGRQRANQVLSAAGQDLDYGLIHADLVKENVLVSSGEVRLIDFDDAGFGWRMFELATVLLKSWDEPEYPVIKRSLFEGYRSCRELSAEDEASLPLFMMLRSFTYLGWWDERRNESGMSAYIEHTIADARSATRAFLNAVS